MLLVCIVLTSLFMARYTKFNNRSIYGRVKANKSDLIIHCPLSDNWSSDFDQYRTDMILNIGSAHPCLKPSITFFNKQIVFYMLHFAPRNLWTMSDCDTPSQHAFYFSSAEVGLTLTSLPTELTGPRRTLLPQLSMLLCPTWSSRRATCG